MKVKKGFIKGRVIPIIMSMGLLFTSVMYGWGDVSFANETVATDTDASEVYCADDTYNKDDSGTSTEIPVEQYTSVEEQPSAESEQYESTYESEGYSVTFKIDNKWDAGYTATVTITNTGEETIENWCMSFPLEQSISNIWNASIEEELDGFYVVKNLGWNQDIATGASVSFGMTVYEAFTGFPEYYTMIGKEITLATDAYSVDYVITEDWGDGYKAEVTITNNKTTALEDWRLGFNYDDNTITQIWNGVILSDENGCYEIGCETYNQNIAPMASVTFGFMVEPGCSGNLMEDISLKEYETDISDGKALVMGYFEEETMELSLSMYSSVTVSSYHIFVSYDVNDFEQVGETEDYAYVYTMADIFEKAEIYAIAYDENGLPIETNHIFVEKIDGEYVLVLPDSDGDGLEDCYEIYYGTDIDDVDTDDDWLNDYYEVYCSYTYPTMMDSDENGVPDGDEDYDEDGLTTLEELALGTEPAWNDTDEDGLLDGDEVNIFGTDPLEADIDEDGLIDGDELALGTDPYVPDTDQDGIIDSEERFYQSYTHMVENKDCIIENVTITLEGTGNLKTNTTIESVMNKDVLCTGVVGLIGEPFEIETESQFDSATITFKIDSSKLGETSFDNLMFLWYDEENQRFVELDTVLDGENETVSVTTTHFSKYMIVDRTVWYEAWEKEIDYNPGSSVTTYYTVLAIDCSGSMKSNDPIIYNNNISSAYDSVYNRKKCNRIQGALEYVDGMSAGDKVAVVFFDSSAEVVLDFTDDKEAVKLALQGIYNSGNTSFNAALKTSFSLFDQSVLDDETICTRVVFLSDGESSYDKKYITTAQTNDIIIHGIGLGGSSDDEALADMSVSTGGVFQKADKSEMLSELYEKIYIYDQFDKTDTDGDGLYDIVETAGIRLCNGQIIYTDPNLPDSDGDKLDDGVEIDPVPRYSDMKWIKDENVGRSPGLVFGFSSDPWLIDTDFDNATDAEDFTPREYNEFLSYIFYPEVGEFYLEYEANVREKRMINIYKKTVEKYETTSIYDFKERWNQMGMCEGKIAYQIDEVHLIYHGGPRNVCIATPGWLYADKNETDILLNNYNEQMGDLTIDDLEKKKISYLNLSSCNNGNIDFMSNKGIEGIYDNMAISFLKSKHDIDLVSAWDGKSNYFGVFLGNNDISISFEIEMSTGDDDFENWSMIVNGKERSPQQKLYYMKFGEEIFYSRFKFEQR